MTTKGRVEKNPKTGAALLDGQDGDLPTQFFRDQRQKIPQNCKVVATFRYLV